MIENNNIDKNMAEDLKAALEFLNEKGLSLAD